ncbi:MAG: EVE domain-containing protein [Micavibrio aeruginosavorus]|uniref:EVE domain-containing protein n=1 Tax=Micavibrio aeruginosavorus TaxID=349221 RepID=A0A2W5N375_9BACT|nr:MAG: EVE domain-containing protein [Micavibrio aeruginosavorus]
MKYWLMKSEPDAWSWDQQVKKKVEPWSGVRNYTAANNMKAMKVGDRAFFYHSNIGKEIVGIVEIVKEYYPDPTDEKGKFGMVDVKAVEPLAKPVTLAKIKETASLKDMDLLRLSRLSVQSVKKSEWDIILKMSK